jgi:L-serine dehydratase
MFLSVFDLFKIGIGPSSSHTMGPMTAAARFLDEIQSGDWPRPQAHVASLKASLHGSLAYTGIGHGTDRAVILGLNGATPITVDLDRADDDIAAIQASKSVTPPGHPTYRISIRRPTWCSTRRFRCRARQWHGVFGAGFRAAAAAQAHLLFDRRRLRRFRRGVAAPEGERAGGAANEVPYPFESAKGMLAMAAKKRPVDRRDEARQRRDAPDPRRTGRRARPHLGRDARLHRARPVEGRHHAGRAEGEAPRAALHDTLQEQWQQNRPNPLLANDWLSIYAMAVNEENAAGGRVVTAPTNGAAGVMPAVLRYWLHFHRKPISQHPRFPAHGRRRRRHHQAQRLDLRRRSRLPGRGGFGLRNGRGRPCAVHGRNADAG